MRGVGRRRGGGQIKGMGIYSKNYCIIENFCAGKEVCVFIFSENSILGSIFLSTKDPQYDQSNLDLFLYIKLLTSVLLVSHLLRNGYSRPDPGF